MKICLVDSSVELSDISLVDFIHQLILSDLDFVIFKSLNWDAKELESFLLELLTKSDITCKKIIVHSQIESARHLGLTYVHLADQRVFEPQKSHTHYTYTLDESTVHSDRFKEIAIRPAMFGIIEPHLLSAFELSRETCVWPIAVYYNDFLEADLAQFHKADIKSIAFSIKNANFVKINDCIELLKTYGF